MKKSLLNLNDVVGFEGEKATVVDLSERNNDVCIMIGNHTYVVDKSDIYPLTETPASQIETPVVSPLPKIKKHYDEKAHSLFIVIDGKTTLCIPHVNKGACDGLGISYKHDNDNYNQELGDALAFYRSSCNEMKAKEDEAECAFPFPFPFLK